MAVKLSQASYDHAKNLAREGRVVADERDRWSEHQPSAQQENEYLEEHGIREYAKWYLGVDDEQSEGTKGRHKYPYGDFRDVHRCGVLAAESRAAQQGHDDIAQAAAHLHGMLEGVAAGR